MRDKEQEPIKTLVQLHEHLQTAILLEHATIPAYLTALYSIKDGCNEDASLVIRSVVIEEMLHMTLAANIMNAVGGRPSINGVGLVPTYPTRLPHSAMSFEVNLECLSEQAIKTFMLIEKPAAEPNQQPQADEYNSIGNFYKAIECGIDYLVEKLGPESVFSGQLSHQVTPEQYYGSGGRLIVVHDRDTAFAAIQEIIDQGEGSPKEEIWETPNKKHTGPHDQAAHYYRFDEIRQGRYYQAKDKPKFPTGEKFTTDYSAVWPIWPNTKAADFPKGSEIQTTLNRFNRSYTDFLNTLHAAFNGQPGLIADTVPVMYDLKYMAQAIMRIPYPGRETKYTVGPSWERILD